MEEGKNKDKVKGGAETHKVSGTDEYLGPKG